MRHNYTDITLRFLQPNKIICREGRVNLQSIPQLLAGFNSQQLRVYLKLHNIYLELTFTNPRDDDNEDSDEGNNSNNSNNNKSSSSRNKKTTTTPVIIMSEQD